MSMLRPVVVAVGALCLLAPLPASAQWGCDAAANLTTNCAFEGGIQGWDPMGASFTHVQDGHFTPGSLEIEAGGTMGYQAEATQCIDGLSGIAQVDVGFWVKAVSGTTMYCSTSISQYASTGCTSGYISFSWVEREAFTAGWDWVGGSFDLDPTVSSLYLNVSCSHHIDPFTVRFDDIYLGPGVEPPLFADGFESGDVGGWDTAVR